MTAPTDQAAPAKGALVSVSQSGQKTSLPFQYNPETLRRSFEPNTLGGSSDARTQAVRFVAAATQTISVECQFSAVDSVGLATPAGMYGVTPQIAALELLTYPSLSQVEAAEQMLAQGAIEIAPQPADTLLFVWGKQSVLPVRLTTVSVVEEFFDTDLWPIRATVSLTMRALTYSDVDQSSLAHQQFIAWQQSMATLSGYAVDTGGGSN